MWIWEPNFKHTSLTRLAEGPWKDLKISCTVPTPHESSHWAAKPPPGTMWLVLHRRSAACCAHITPSRKFSGSYWAVLSQWHILQTRVSPRAEQGELGPFAQTRPCCNRCWQLLHSKITSPLSGQVWTLAHGDLAISDPNSCSPVGRMSWPGSLSWGLMTALPCITISHSSL